MIFISSFKFIISNAIAMYYQMSNLNINQYLINVEVVYVQFLK